MLHERPAGNLAPSSERGLVWGLSSMTFLLWVGGSAMLPLLPSYLRANGTSPALIGVVMAAYFAASVLSQYPAGRLSDRIGRRPILLVGLVIFAGGSIGFSLSTGAGLAIVFRALQGIGAGASTVAAGATIGSVVGLDRRGRAFGMLYGSQMLAFAIGPLVGSIIGAGSIRLLFVLGAAIAMLGMFPVFIVVPNTRLAIELGPSGTSLSAERDAGSSFLVGRRPLRLIGRGSQRSGAVLGAVLAFGATGLTAGVYESCWTLLLRSRNASPFDIGLSWTLFAVPFALLSVPAGKIAQRFDKRKLAIAALAVSAGCAVYYPFIHSLRILVSFGSLEAIGSVVGTPAAVLMLSAAVPAHQQGEAQGAVETARTAATAIAAAASGSLFAIDPVLPFAIAAGIVLVAIGLIARAWSRVASSTGQDGGGMHEPEPAT